MAPFESTDHGFLPQDLATTSDVTFGSLQIAEKVLFQYSGSSPHALAEIDAKKDGTNGGDLEFYPFPVLPANLLIARSVGPSGALRTAIMQRPRRGEVRGLAS